jgi:hypothetical protein
LHEKPWILYEQNEVKLKHVLTQIDDPVWWNFDMCLAWCKLIGVLEHEGDISATISSFTAMATAATTERAAAPTSAQRAA